MKPQWVACKVKLLSHWDTTISRLVGDKGLRYKHEFLPFFTLRSHWTLSSRHIFNYIDDTRTTVVRHLRECLTTVVRYSCERLMTMRHSRECLTSREIFVQASHDVRANFNQFYFSQLSLEMVLFISHICRIVQIAETSLRCVCERLPRVGDGFATYAMTWQRFCDDFCRTKKYYMFKTLVNRSRCMRRLCDTMRTFRDSFANRFANPSRTRRIPVR